MDDKSPDQILNAWLNANYERRTFRRWAIKERGAVKFYGKEDECLVHDISPGGACVEFDSSAKLTNADKIVLRIEGMSPLLAEVRSIFDGQLGLAFLHDKEGQEALAQWLTLEENTRRQHRREEIECDVTLYNGDAELSAQTQNISLGGAKIEGPDVSSCNEGDEISVEFDGVGPIKGSVRYNSEQSIGITFQHDPESLKALIHWLKTFREQTK